MKVVYDDLIWWSEVKSPSTCWYPAAEYAKKLAKTIKKENIEIWWEELPLKITVNKKEFS